jgi:hypothetical protein
MLRSFAGIQLSGDSGRKNDTIAPRSRRPIPEAIQQELQDPATRRSLLNLCEQMGYPLKPQPMES